MLYERAGVRVGKQKGTEKRNRSEGRSAQSYHLCNVLKIVLSILAMG